MVMRERPVRFGEQAQRHQRQLLRVSMATRLVTPLPQSTTTLSRAREWRVALDDRFAVRL